MGIIGNHQFYTMVTYDPHFLPFCLCLEFDQSTEAYLDVSNNDERLIRFDDLVNLLNSFHK